MSEMLHLVPLVERELHIGLFLEVEGVVDRLEGVEELPLSLQHLADGQTE
jgi:hypothetical protein